MISIPHPIRLLITKQYSFLYSMLYKFPFLHAKWIEEQEKDAKKLANRESNGDFEIYQSIYKSEMSKFESCTDEEQLFYQGTFIMVYSYYESILMRISKEEGLKSSRPSDIAGKYGVKLDYEYIEISEYIRNTILPLRNQLCHNNNGTLFTRNKDHKENEKLNIQKLIDYNSIEIEDGVIYIKDSRFIQETLYKEYRLLIKLADICNYKTKYCGMNKYK